MHHVVEGEAQRMHRDEAVQHRHRLVVPVVGGVETERQPEVLKTLCFRLGLIYADRLVDMPMALKAFQRALTYQPDDRTR
jgi:hypothetical protein